MQIKPKIVFPTLIPSDKLLQRRWLELNSKSMPNNIRPNQARERFSLSTVLGGVARCRAPLSRVKIIISRRRTKLLELYVVFMKFKVFGKIAAGRRWKGGGRRNSNAIRKASYALLGGGKIAVCY
ncbi:hypothetical protein Trydic_g9090 [Trypoxylus dichotomus]